MTMQLPSLRPRDGSETHTEMHQWFFSGFVGWRAEYITPFLDDEEIADAWHRIVIIFGNGELPNWMQTYGCGARGLLCSSQRRRDSPRPSNQAYRPGVDRCRPIAAGDFTMRVATQYGCELDKEAIVEHLSPLQLGVGS